MAVVPDGFDTSKVVSTGRERKCGTCRNFVVKPPEVELAKYALPIGACGPGIHCLGGAVRGTCSAIGVMAESTNMAVRAPCAGHRYLPGGPTVLGMDAVNRAMGGSPNRKSSDSDVLGAVVDGSFNGALLPIFLLAGVAAAKEVKKRFFGGS
jgi:hypothetical protein